MKYRYIKYLFVACLVFIITQACSQPPPPPNNGGPSCWPPSPDCNPSSNVPLGDEWWNVAIVVIGVLLVVYYSRVNKIKNIKK